MRRDERWPRRAEVRPATVDSSYYCRMTSAFE